MTGHAVEDLVLKAAGALASFYSKSTAFTSSSLMTADKGTLAWFVELDLQFGATSD